MGFLKTALLVPLVLVALGQLLNLALRKQYAVHDPAAAACAVLITGASSGIGRHAAVSLAKRGFTVYAGVRKQKDADSLAGEGVKGLKGVLLDVTQPDTIDSAFESIQAAGLPLVALVNNAGIARTFPAELMDVTKDARANFEVNYFGVIAVTQKFLPLLRQAGPGARLVQISSVAGIISSAGGNPYSATKFALESLNDALRLELAPFKIAVSAVNPAFVATPILGRPGGKGEVNKKAAKAATSKEQLALYGHILNEKNAAEEQKMYALADSPQVTTDAIEHAITSPYPQVRYIVANVGGVPAWVYCYLKWYAPERLLDAIVLAVQGIES